MKKRNLIKYLIFSSLILFFIDFVYKTYNEIDHLTREKCILYQTLPRPLFLFLEHYIILFLTIILGIFIAVLLEKYYLRYKKFYPKNPLQAFIYGSLIPICSCGAIPIVGSFKDKIKLRTIITFIVAAPLLSPYFITLSLTVLGLKFTILRILASFILAVTSGYLIEGFVARRKITLPETHGCKVFLKEKDIYLRTYGIIKLIFPYFLIAATLGIVVEILSLEKIALNIDILNPHLKALVVILIGIPMYLCNGADILILRPFITHLNFPLGAAIGFSLTSTAICVTSITILSRYLGKKVTLILITHIFLLSFFLAILINIFF